MGKARLGKRLSALFLLAVAVLSGAEASLALRAANSAGAMPETAATAPTFLILLSLLVAGALACLLAAWRLWNAPDSEASRPALLFGRNAGSPSGAAWRAPALLAALPLLVLAAVAINHTALWRIPSEPSLLAPPSPSPAPPAAEPAASASPDPAPPASLPDLTTVPPGLARPPEQAAQPDQPPPQAAPAPADPPVTTAPTPPPPPPLPIDAAGHRDAVVWLDVSSDGRMLLSASTDRTIKLWDMETKRLIRDLGVHKDMARTALFMPDGATALTAGDDGEIVLRALADGKVLHVFSAGGNGDARKLAITPDGKRAVSGHDTGTVIVWDLDNGKALHVLTGHQWSISAVAVSPDGHRALTSDIDGELRLWDIDAGTLLSRWKGHERGAYGIVFADARYVLTGSGDDTIKLWDLQTGKEKGRLDGHSGTVYALALSPDRKWLLSGSLDGSARLWDMVSGKQAALFDPGTGPIYAVAFAADGSVLTGGIDRTIRRWPIAGGAGTILFAGAPDK